MASKRVYCKIDGYDNIPTIRLGEMSTFEQMFTKFKPEFIFISSQEVETAGGSSLLGNKSNKKQVNIFSFHNNDLVYTINANGYETIEDYKDGDAKGYKNGHDYYQAKEGNFIDREEFEECQNAGFQERLDFLKAKSSGFVNASAKIEQAFLEGRIPEKEYKKAQELGKDSQIYSLSNSLGYNNFEEFEKALEGGFIDRNASEYRDAIEQGFGSSESYDRAKEGNFADPAEFEAATTAGITNSDTFENYKKLKGIQDDYGFRTLQQANVLSMLADLEPGRKLSVARIWDMLKESEAEITGRENSHKKWFDRPILELFAQKKSPSWYTDSFKDIVELKVFLISNENVNKIGAYEADGEVFERKSFGNTSSEAKKKITNSKATTSKSKKKVKKNQEETEEVVVDGKK